MALTYTEVQEGERESKVSKVSDELSKKFDEMYGSLNGCSILTKEEYQQHKEFLIKSGLFLFQLKDQQVRAQL
jgi:hypothetical protein